MSSCYSEISSSKSHKNTSPSYNLPTDSSSRAMSSSSSSENSRIGMIADVQYADVEDGSDFSGEERRRFRASLEAARRASAVFRAEKVDMLLQLGDAIDGKSGAENCVRDLGRVFGALEEAFVKDKTGIERLDIMGNHELYCAPRSQLSSLLNHYDKEADLLRYSRTLEKSPAWRIIVLDSYGISLLDSQQKSTNDPRYLEACSIIDKENPQVLRAGKNVDWFEGVPEDKFKFVPYNGALGSTQQNWLIQELQDSFKNHQYVAIFSHIPIFQPTFSNRTILWDSEQVLSIISEHGSHVVAFFSGHVHQWRYSRDGGENGVHHPILASPLVRTEDRPDAHYVLEFSRDEPRISLMCWDDCHEPGERLEMTREVHFKDQ